LAAIAPTTSVALVSAAAVAGIRAYARLVLAALLSDASFVPAFWISADAVVNHRESALASFTLTDLFTALVTLLLAAAPASMLSIALLDKASITGDTTGGPSLGVCADALRVVAGRGCRRTGWCGCGSR